MSDRRTLNFYQADVFTGQPFGGNPVAVFPDAHGLTDYQLQQIAREMNLSETVFVLPPTDQAAVVRLRIFTPTQEIPFAGHPVLGTFYVLAQLGLIAVTDGDHPRDAGMQHRPLSRRTPCREGQVTRVVMTQPKPDFLGPVDEMEDVYKIAGALGLPKYTITRHEVADRSGVHRTASVDRAGAHAHGCPLDPTRRLRHRGHLRSVWRERDYALYDGHRGTVCDGPCAHVRPLDRDS